MEASDARAVLWDVAAALLIGTVIMGALVGLAWQASLIGYERGVDVCESLHGGWR